MVNRRLLGNIGEAKAKTFFIEKGYDIFIPETVNPPFDFIAIKDDTCYKIEVKSSNSKNGEIKLHTCYTTTKKHISKLFNSVADLLILYHHPTNTLKIVKCEDFINRNSVRIHIVNECSV